MKINSFVKYYQPGEGICNVGRLSDARCGCQVAPQWIEALPAALQPQVCAETDGFLYTVGEAVECPQVEEAQGYALVIAPMGIAVRGADAEGLGYGLDTLAQFMSQKQMNALPCLTIRDYPSILKRGLMLDISRGKVYTREYLMELVKRLAKMRFNVFQLYTEHTFAFPSHPEIWENSGAITSEDILEIQKVCKTYGIELQANLQSLGHARRILTRPEHMELAESDMYWSYATKNEDTFKLIDELYADYLPLFESPWLNVCLDEPYDLGAGYSAEAKAQGEDLYIQYFLRLHELAAKYGKKIMAFGDVFRNHPERLDLVPDDIIYVDWCYDPKPEYGTPAIFGKSGREFWICPGTGNWNTLFPRMDGALMNITQMVKEGVAAHTGGMLLTDWNDHGAYSQHGTGFFTYAFAAAAAWTGCAAGEDALMAYTDRILGMEGYSAAIRKLAEIYWIPPFWSKNRSQCGMALFDEPIFGKAIRGPKVPASARAYDLALPEGVEPVFERHSQHPLRPVFRVGEEERAKVRAILSQAEPMVEKLPESQEKNQLNYIMQAFRLMLDKLDFSDSIIAKFATRQVSTQDLLILEDQLRVFIRRFVQLQFAYAKVWTEIARFSEMELSMTYFAHIIARMDYLRDWLSIQRELISVGKTVDFDFATYETAGYSTLPTY